MLPHRKSLLAAAIVLVGGSITWTASYAYNLRSDVYRRKVQEDLTSFFELPCEVGRIRGRTFSSRTFEDVVIWLPNQRDRVFSCKDAIWQENESDGVESNELKLISGMLAIRSDRWVKEDYRRVLESSLGHDFEDLKLVNVDMEGFEISFERGDFRLSCRDTSGSIDFSDPKSGVARLHAYELNGRPIAQGVQIHARFIPQGGVQVSELLLTVPKIPLVAMGIGPLLGGNHVEHGEFAGSLQYIDHAERPEVWMQGELADVELAELTRSVAWGPLEGRFSVNVDAARVSGEVVTHFRGKGRIEHLQLAPFARLFGQDELAGDASINLDAVDLAVGHIERLRLSGSVTGITLEDWLRPWGRGSATGRLSVRINNLDIVDDNIKSADVEVVVVPPPGQSGTIDRELLLSAAQDALSFTWPSAVPQSLLPESVEYAEFGMRLLVRDNKLRILGTHGPSGNTILTIKVGGMAFGVVKEEPESIDLTPRIAALREKAVRYNPDRVREWWQQHGGGRKESR